MTWISESSGMWFPHQVRKLVHPLDEKIEMYENANKMLGKEREAWKAKTKKLHHAIEDALSIIDDATMFQPAQLKLIDKFLREALK